MESYLPISFLNDFIFCPRSIYFHQLYGKLDTQLYQQKPQVAGKAAHATIDNQNYSTRKEILQGMEVYSQKYQLCGKIDLFDGRTGRLTERKREIKVVYDGYVFQMYAQFFALQEMGFEVKSLVLHDLLHNRNYEVKLPDTDKEMFEKFEALLTAISEFVMDDPWFEPNQNKCENCIYNNLCDFSLC